MNGQWMGTYSNGAGRGRLVVELDDIRDHYSGVAYFYSEQKGLPVTIAEIKLPKDSACLSTRVPLFAVERGTARFIPIEELEKALGGRPSTWADVSWTLSPEKISATWKSEAGNAGTGTALASTAGEKSTLETIPGIASWEDFKATVLKFKPNNHIFRGQENSDWALRTAFHRTGRANLFRFMSEDIPALHRHLTAITPHRFNTNEPDEYAALLNLVQHHGYPTPLLDWTASPFIAAYFAFNNLRRGNYRADQKVRIHIFEARDWQGSFERAQRLHPAFLHITVLEPLPLNNPRLIPQQGMSLPTNLDDIERYIKEQETVSGRRFLTAIDLSVGERRTVMHELDLMGINAGSLFPGLDGICGQIREKYFDL